MKVSIKRADCKRIPSEARSSIMEFLRDHGALALPDDIPPDMMEMLDSVTAELEIRYQGADYKIVIVHDLKQGVSDE